MVQYLLKGCTWVQEIGTLIGLALLVSGVINKGGQEALQT